MLAILKYKDIVFDEFYLDKDDVTIRRKTNGYYGRWEIDDKAVPFKFTAKNCYEYEGLHIPRTRTTIGIHWILTLLRGVEFEDGSVIDHLDGNPKNNVRENLRITSQHINCRNRKLRKDSSTGYAGINFRDNLYIVRRYVSGKRMYASAKTLKEAITKLGQFNALAESEGKAYIDR